jgi:hypothetical protein
LVLRLLIASHVPRFLQYKTAKRAKTRPQNQASHDTLRRHRSMKIKCLGASSYFRRYVLSRSFTDWAVLTALVPKLTSKIYKQFLDSSALAPIAFNSPILLERSSNYKTLHWSTLLSTRSSSYLALTARADSNSQHTIFLGVSVGFCPNVIVTKSDRRKSSRSWCWQLHRGPSQGNLSSFSNHSLYASCLRAFEVDSILGKRHPTYYLPIIIIKARRGLGIAE